MKTILVPIEYWEAHANTVGTAFSLARDGDTRLVFLHVIDPIYSVQSFGVDYAGIETIEVNEAPLRTAFGELVARAKRETIDAEARIVWGNPVDQILKLAGELEPALIVMGSRRHGSLYDLIVGSTTKGVIKAAACPVVVVPVEKDERRHPSPDRDWETHTPASTA